MNAIEKRQQKEKELLIEQLRKIPIIQIACEKIGIARATYYRWTKEDKKFSECVQSAIAEGKALINDMAISQLLSAIHDRSLPAILFWLRHNHEDYKDKVEITTNNKTETLTEEQQQLIASALEKGGLLTQEKKEDDHG